MEQEQETDESLIALTTHFAQVQFRLKQIISADPQQKEQLLKQLEEFAFQGCTRAISYDTAAAGENGSTEAQRSRRAELMEKLRDQLDELEQCAQEAVQHPPEQPVSGTLAEKQQIIIDELRKRFDLHFGDLESLSTEEVKENVDKAVHDIVSPIRSKNELLSQLQTQVQDLERYIVFLRADPSRTQSRTVTTQAVLSARPCYPPLSHHHSYTGEEKPPGRKKGKRVTFAPSSHTPKDVVPPPSPASRRQLLGPMLQSRHQPVPQYHLSLTQLDGVHCAVDTTMMEWEKMDSLGEAFYDTPPADDLHLSLLVMRKTLAVVQVLTLWQCGGRFQCLPRYVADGKRKKYHAALHSLELAVDKIAIITTALNEPGINRDSVVSLETDLHEAVSMSLADSLRVLLENGLVDAGEPVPYNSGCTPMWVGWGGRERREVGECAAWRVFKHYYGVKNGKQFSARPDQLLSLSFAISVDGNTSVKKTLLMAIHRVENIYSKCQQRTRDTKFRALICEGFNLCHLAEWFRILATHPSVAEDLYGITSFLATTGFRPAIASLERLKDNPQCQPVCLPQLYYQCTEAF